MKVVNGIVKLLAIVLGAVFLTRALYTTELGGRVLRAIPDGIWSKVYAFFGLEGAETTANAELALWLSICFAVSAFLVLGVSRLLRHFFDGRQR